MCGRKRNEECQARRGLRPHDDTIQIRRKAPAKKDGRIVDRTRDLQIFSLTLSQLSYAPQWRMMPPKKGYGVFVSISLRRQNEGDGTMHRNGDESPQRGFKPDVPSEDEPVPRGS